MAADDKGDNRKEKFWAIRDVPEHVRRVVKSYAANHGLSMADALELLVLRGAAIGVSNARDPALGVLRDFPDKILAAHVQRVLDEITRRNALSPEERVREETERLRTIQVAAADPSVEAGDAYKLMAEYLRDIEQKG